MKLFAGVIIFMICNNLCFSQSERDMRIIDFGDLEFVEDLGKKIYVSEVIDNRFDRTSIGIIQLGIYNNRQFVTLAPSFTDQLQVICNKLLPKSVNKSSFVIRINELFIAEESKAFSEGAKAYVNIDVLSKLDGSYFFQKNYSNLVLNENFSLDVTGKHKYRIVEAIRNCIEEFSLDFENSNLNNRRIELEKSGDFDKNLSDHTSPTLFSNYVDFYNGFEITDSISYTKKENPNRDMTEKIFLKNEDEEHLEESFFYDGKDYYINAKVFSNKAYFVRTHKIDEFLLFNDRVMSNYFLAMGKSGLFYHNERRCYVFSVKTGIVYMVLRGKMKTLLEDDYP